SLISWLISEYYYTNVNSDYEMGKRKEYSTGSVVTLCIGIFALCIAFVIACYNTLSARGDAPERPTYPEYPMY
ncbi:hypothetical protein EBU71_23555, partial [bacterium]|nr:hypothetical protein [Candidatus Elulimicrobium humile]